MKKSGLIYTILFCTWLGINYLGAWTNATYRMADYLADRDDPEYFSSFQIWFFLVLNNMFDSIVIAVATGVLAYQFRDLRVWQYLVLALFVRYFVLVILLPMALWKHSLSQIFESLRESASAHHLFIAALIQLFFAVIGAYVGMNFGRNTPFSDAKDEQLGFIGGVPKKVLAILIICFNPIAQLVTDASLVLMYQFSLDVSSGEYWRAAMSNLFSMNENSSGGIITLLVRFFLVWLFWVIAFGVFYFGIQSIRDKSTRHRILKILAIFVVLPVAIVLIPLLRNRTWFF